MKELLTAYAAYNLWANKILTDFILKLSPGMASRELPSSFSSIQLTLYHMHQAESSWWQRMMLAERIEMPPDNLKMDTEALCKALIKQSQKWQQWVASKNKMALTHVIHYHNLKKELFKQPVSEILMQVFNHATYHRGQLVNMLRQLGQQGIPQTDYIVWSRLKK